MIWYVNIRVQIQFNRETHVQWTTDHFKIIVPTEHGPSENESLVML